MRYVFATAFLGFVDTLGVSCSVCQLQMPGFKRSFTLTLPPHLARVIEQDMVDTHSSTPQQSVLRLLEERLSASSEEGADRATRNSVLMEARSFIYRNLGEHFAELSVEMHKKATGD